MLYLAKVRHMSKKFARISEQRFTKLCRNIVMLIKYYSVLVMLSYQRVHVIILIILLPYLARNMHNFLHAYVHYNSTQKVF